MAREEADNGRDDMVIDTALPEGFNANYLKTYYGKLFPHADIFKWLSYGNDGKHPGCDQSYSGRREYSFTLDNDIYLRFQSFNSVHELESSIKEKCPFKIDIGPVYSVDPAKRHAYGQAGQNVFTPVERELIFDIDITDYDDVRYCCSGADVCLDCWPLMTVAIKVIDTALRDDFGFNHILWVYSGRRGVHCWVCDSKARRLNNEQRAAIADYFRVYKGNENSQRKVALLGHALHPFLVRAYTEVLREYFEEKLLSSQQLFSSEERFEKILEMIPDESITSELRGKWQENRRSSISKEDVNALRWGQLKHMLQSGKQKSQVLRRCVEEIVFSYSYPRLDMEVSKHMNHLLKAPFCVHPKTGRVCVPIDPKNCEEFDPTKVPTLSQLLGELNMGGQKIGDGGEDEWEGTSMDKAIKYFRTSFLQPLLKVCKEEIENSYNAKLQQSRNSFSW
ncbi:DNA primase small subunit [Impatiens glandulifera]|uniref:DNA primase small subunit n=1 Tax=Impatiens glandulifera TaxID=253017 RepID=UPI001FB17124|nr:DNA primase small subunit [Impatiens glandulifera]XP_047329114.1 DNA primase small subunit [Impatiens glandulifera]